MSSCTAVASSVAIIRYEPSPTITKTSRSGQANVETDPLIGAPDSESWWDVPVSTTSTLESTQTARRVYEKHKATQRPLLRPTR